MRMQGLLLQGSPLPIFYKNYPWNFNADKAIHCCVDSVALHQFSPELKKFAGKYKMHEGQAIRIRHLDDFGVLTG